MFESQIYFPVIITIVRSQYWNAECPPPHSFFALLTDVVRTFPFDPPPTTILPYFINTSRLILSSCIYSHTMTVEPVHRLVMGVMLSVGIPSPQFSLVCCAGLFIIANTMPCGSNEFLPYGEDCHFFWEY